MAQVTLQDLKQQKQLPAVEVGFQTIDGFTALQRMAGLFTKSSIVPVEFRGDINLGNACIALDMALRMHANPLMVMQNLYIVQGRPSWSAQFLIATLNQSGRFSALRYQFTGEKNTDAWGCRAVATELATGEKLEGPEITIALAKKEGWYGKNGSKWQTMPEMMLRYRAASWFVRAYAPEIAMGLPEQGELEDTVIDVVPTPAPAPDKPEISVEEVKEKATRGRKKEAAAKTEPEKADVVEVTVEEAPAVQPASAVQQAEPVADNAPPAPAAHEPVSVSCPDRNGTTTSVKYCNSKCPRRNGCPAFD